mmetsp:Transcript_5508/g.13225  ORF Transcript_5508/g.13225 Transcript_5508/m.13225 type:complete len:293 (-) Transcript_5508:532-1410(-)
MRGFYEAEGRAPAGGQWPRPPSLKTPTTSCMRWAWPRRLSAAAAACSTRAAFCCVTRSSWAIASLTWPMPVVCSWVAAPISVIRSATRFTCETISVMVSPASPTRREPASTLSTLWPIRVLISRAAWALRWARARTSPATTAKPLPCSPARAASTAAFRASRLVWKAMLSMSCTISPIRWDDAAMPPMVSVTECTTSALRRDTSCSSPTTPLAACVPVLVWRTVAAICSMLATVCCRFAAWASVRPARSWLPRAISSLPRRIRSISSRVSVTMARRLTPTWASEASSPRNPG